MLPTASLPAETGSKPLNSPREDTLSREPSQPSQPSELPVRPRIWNPAAQHAPLPKDTEDIIEEATRPLADISDAMSRPYVQKSLNNRMLEIMAWSLMESMTSENDSNQHIRRFLNILLGDDPDTAHLELIDSYNSNEVTIHDQLLHVVQESLSRSDEFLYRMSESRDRVAFAVEQKSQLKHHLDKAANSSNDSLRRG
ncbi:hypothetical protein GGI21_004373 [Coemansia aciculifera]|nr:hypothetical protein GGI21_004373 [Coemansia aciculifera]